MPIADYSPLIPKKNTARNLYREELPRYCVRLAMGIASPDAPNRAGPLEAASHTLSGKPQCAELSNCFGFVIVVMSGGHTHGHFAED
jgi:hypothetical protein